MLATDCCTPHELRLVAVKLQSIGSHPVGYSVDTVSDSNRNMSTCDGEQEP